MKKCTQCGEEKNESEFYKSKHLKSGLRSNCKICQNAVSKKWRDANPSAQKGYRDKHYQTHKHLWEIREKNMSTDQKQRKREYCRKYHEENRDKIATARREKYRLIPEEQKRKANQQYYDQNRDKICARSRKTFEHLSDEQKKSGVDRVRAWRSQNREKARAWSCVGNAITRGELIKPNKCEKCGMEDRIHAHHDDYSRPLDIQWLCHKCHMKIHYKMRRI